MSLVRRVLPRQEHPARDLRRRAVPGRPLRQALRAPGHRLRHRLRIRLHGDARERDLAVGGRPPPPRGHRERAGGRDDALARPARRRRRRPPRAGGHHRRGGDLGPRPGHGLPQPPGGHAEGVRLGPLRLRPRVPHRGPREVAGGRYSIVYDGIV